MVVVSIVDAGMAGAYAGSEMACQLRMGHANFCAHVFDALGDHQARVFPRGVLVLIAAAAWTSIAGREFRFLYAPVFASGFARAGGEILRRKFQPRIGSVSRDYRDQGCRR